MNSIDVPLVAPNIRDIPKTVIDAEYDGWFELQLPICNAYRHEHEFNNAL